jgi:hypothetical protein
MISRSTLPPLRDIFVFVPRKTRLKGEPTISNYGTQGKSQGQLDGREGPNGTGKWLETWLSKSGVTS